MVLRKAKKRAARDGCNSQRIGSENDGLLCLDDAVPERDGRKSEKNERIAIYHSAQ